MRNLSFLDQLIDDVDRALRSLAAPASLQNRPLPIPGPENTAEYFAANAKQGDEPGSNAPIAEQAAVLDENQRRHIAGLMRINHAGEVAAQALYFGHARMAKTEAQRAHMLHAAAEEGDHLAWCAARLESLGARPSLFGPIWYGGAYVMGLLSAAAGDRFALGFVAETEAQVEAHLQDHVERIPKHDVQSIAILDAMRADEAAHGQAAKNAGGQALPWPVPQLMRKTADIMRAIAYRI